MTNHYVLEKSKIVNIRQYKELHMQYIELLQNHAIVPATYEYYSKVETVRTTTVSVLKITTARQRLHPPTTVSRTVIIENGCTSEGCYRSGFLIKSQKDR